MAKKIKIQLRKSLIGRKPKQRKTVHALGLRKINQSVIKDVNPETMGMVRTVSHMLSVEEIE
jgi:large subunit ribosomal protein L30